MDQPTHQRKLIITAGILIGMGFAGFFDGIVLHQILQWHHMLTSVQPLTDEQSVAVNTFWDGLFNAATYGLTATGLISLWRAAHQERLTEATKPFMGAFLLGAGLFNSVEGVIDHHLLGIHHVKSGPNEMLWDISFLVLGVLLTVIGGVILSSKPKEITAS